MFGGALGIRRTFILHANGSKLPSDLLGLTSVRYDPATSPAEVRAINQKLRKAIETEGRRGPVEGLWWQLSLTMRSEDEPSCARLLATSEELAGRSESTAPPGKALYFASVAVVGSTRVAPLSPAMITAQGAPSTTFRLTLPCKRPTIGPSSRVPTTIKS